MMLLLMLLLAGTLGGVQSCAPAQPFVTTTYLPCAHDTQLLAAEAQCEADQALNQRDCRLAFPAGTALLHQLPALGNVSVFIAHGHVLQLACDEVRWDGAATVQQRGRYDMRCDRSQLQMLQNSTRDSIVMADGLFQSHDPIEGMFDCVQFRLGARFSLADRLLEERHLLCTLDAPAMTLCADGHLLGQTAWLLLYPSTEDCSDYVKNTVHS